MSIGIIITVALITAFIVLLIVIATRPSAFTIARSADVSGSPETVFGLIQDFRKWTAWSPWEHLDPNLHRKFSGAPMGTGAVYDWEGNKQAGQGRMTILESRPGALVVIKLEFIKPFAVTNKTTFTLTPKGTGTHVNWKMEGTNGFMMKGFSFFCNMDKMVGKDFEKGLAGLDAASKN